MSIIVLGLKRWRDHRVIIRKLQHCLSVIAILKTLLLTDRLEGYLDIPDKKINMSVCLTN
jgi:hypothetical protein